MESAEKIRAKGVALLAVMAALLLCFQAVFAFRAYATPSQTAVVEDVDVVVDGITYTVDLDTDAKTACITDVSDPATESAVAMPESFEHEGSTYTVTSLHWGFFSSERDNITGLTLPETLESVNGASFGKFPNLTELTIPGSVKVFDGEMQYMKKLKTLTFAEGVEEIASNSMLRNCSALETVNLPESLVRITGPSAFSGATALRSISLPANLQVMEGSLFSECTSLESIELPATMDKVPYSMFSGCTSLTEVKAATPITEIGSSAFSGCSSLKSVFDLSNVTKIGEYAFNKCTVLETSLALGNVTEMGGYAFNECKKLSGALDLTSLDVVPSHAFTYVSGITSIDFSSQLESIGTWAFVWADVDQLNFPDTLGSIGNFAFYAASSLGGTVVIPDNVVSVGKGAFQYSAVERFEVGSGVVEADASAFESTALKEIVFNNSQDDVTIAGSFADGVNVVYKLASIDDSVGDAISSAPGAPSLQQAIDEAALAGGTVKIEKHIKLSGPVVVAKGQTVAVTSDEEFQIAGAKSAADLKNLFVVEPGGSLAVDGKVVLSGRYNTGSVVLNEGAFELTGEAVVTGSKLLDDLANATGDCGLGVIDSRGADARFVMSGGTITGNALNGNGMAYSGIVYVGEGARMEMSGGEISGNRAVAANALSCSAGVLLRGNATASMGGGVISENSGHRGSAVMLFGDDDAHRTTFELSGDASIQDNVCTSATGVQGSGAVHVESNADFAMTGGSITGNKGVQGAGVCVVDGNLQNGQSEYRTGFVMSGGSISGNTGSTGGGVYSYSNGTELKAGSIVGNTAYRMGGGVYSEGNYDYYSTLHLSNALITDNFARLGGGMWFCATGETTVHVTEGVALFGNVAESTDAGDSAGDDFVFSGREADDYSATLADRMLGGASVKWYADGAVYLPSTGVYPSVSADKPRYDAANPGEPVTVVDGRTCLALKSVPFSDEAKSLAEGEAALVISGNKADMGGGIGANGGVIAGTEDETQVKVSKVWKGDSEGERPESVTVQLLNGETVIDSAVLSAENGWSCVFEGLPACNAQGVAYEFSVAEVAVPGYSIQVEGDAASGFVITNTKTEKPGPIDPVGPDEPADPDGPVDPDGPADSGHGSSQGQGGSGSLPSTGDGAGMAMLIAAAVSCAAAILAAFLMRKRAQSK